MGIAPSLPKVYLNKVEQDGWTSRELELSRTSEKVGKLDPKGKDSKAKVEFTRYIPRTMSYIVTCSIEDKHILKFFTDKNLKTQSDIVIEGFVKSSKRKISSWI